MKIIIVNSPLFKEKRISEEEKSIPSIGLGLIATAIKAKGFDVELIDSVSLNIPLNDLLTIVIDRTPTFICINIFTTNLDLVKEFIESIKINVHFIIGGLATQDLYKDIFNWKSSNPIDIIYGDGELIVPDILLNNIKEKAVEEKDNRRFFKVDNLSNYFVKDISFDNLDRSFLIGEPRINHYGEQEAHIVTGRGCIYNCAFCAAAKSINGDIVIREKSKDSIIAEIGYLQNIYENLKSVRILDDLFLKNNHSIIKAISIFNKFNLKWRSMSHVLSFNDSKEKILSELRNSGCSELFIGIDSGSPKILKKIHKNHNIELIKQNLTKILANNISIKGYFIYGFPDETEEDFKLTYDLAVFLKKQSKIFKTPFRTSVFQFRPYHGTELFRYIIENNKYPNPVKPNNQLSSLIGRQAFNFESGNYSEADITVVNEYISKTDNINKC